MNAIDIPDDVSIHSNDTDMSSAKTEPLEHQPTVSERFMMVSFLTSWNTARKNVVDLEKAKVLKHFTLDDYKELMHSNRCYVEYFGKRSNSTKIRPYFDIDAPVDTLPDPDSIHQLLMHHIQVISRILTELYMVNRELTLDDFAVSSSHGLDIKNQGVSKSSKMKVSFHVVLIGHCMTRYESLGNVIITNQLTKGNDGYWFDPSVYKEDEQCWRNVGMVKEDEKHHGAARVMVPVNHKHQLELHFPSYLVGNEQQRPRVKHGMVLSGVKPPKKAVAATKVGPMPKVAVTPGCTWEDSSESESDDEIWGSDSEESVEGEPKWCKTHIRLDSKLDKKISEGILKLIQKYPGHGLVSYDRHEISQKDDRFSLSTYWKSNGSKRLCPSRVQHNHGSNNFYVNVSVNTGDIFYACMKDVKECGEKRVKICKMPEKTHNKLIEDINSKAADVAKSSQLNQQVEIWMGQYLSKTNCTFDVSETLQFASELQVSEYPVDGLKLFTQYMNKHWVYVKGGIIELIKCDFDDTGRMIKFYVKKHRDYKIHFQQFNKYNVPISESTTVKLIDYWLDNHNEYKDAKVWKPIKEAPNEFNMFIEPNFVRLANTPAEFDPSKVEVLNYHLKEIICAGDPEVYDLFIKWFAWIVQNGLRRHYKALAVVICIIGEIQGTGKSMFVEWVGDYIFGEETYSYTQNVDDLTQQFNAAVSEKLFIYLNDIGTWDGSNKVWSMLKGRFGSKTQQVRKLYQEAYKADNIANNIIDSNDRNAIKLEPTNRRYWILEVMKKMPGEYYTKLARALNEDTALHWVKFLLTIDLSNYNPHCYEKATKETNLGKQMRYKQFHPICAFLQEHVVEGEAFDNHKYKDGFRMTATQCKNIYDSLSDTSIRDDKEFKAKMEQYGNIRMQKSGIWYYVFPSKDNITQNMILKNVWMDIECVDKNDE